jgi:hypothetical protein
MGMYRVKNVNGTGSERYKDPPSGYSSWIKYWEEMTGMKALSCHCDTHRKTVEEKIVGAHVLETNKWYIVPLCNTHNTSNYFKDTEFIVEDPLVPVSPNNKIKW